MSTSDGEHKQLPDQEFWADHYFFLHLDEAFKRLLALSNKLGVKLTLSAELCVMRC